jgi:hypothetical protein
MDMRPDIQKNCYEPSEVHDEDRKLHAKVSFVLVLEEVCESVVSYPHRNDPKTIERLGSLIDRYFVQFRSDDPDDSMFWSLFENLIRTTISLLHPDDRLLLEPHLQGSSSIAASISELSYRKRDPK